MRRHLLLLAAKFRENQSRMFKELEGVDKLDPKWNVYYTWLSARHEVEEQLAEFDSENS